jgi:YegS/Rv2252/BmrU family lipid kinase
MAEDPLNTWLVIVNPNAGAGKCLRDWPRIEKLLVSFGILYHKVFTIRKLHAILISRNYINLGHNKIIVVGGDGTMNEVINGIFAQKRFETSEITLGMIPVGTGNDWGRMFGITGNYEEAIRTIKEFKTFVQDAGKVVFEKNNRMLNRYFVNIASLGFGAMVVKKSNRLKDKGKGNPAMYLFNIFTSLFGYKSVRASIEVDGVASSNDVFSLSLGICKYNGGGMMQLPDAKPDDGLFDLTLIKKIGRIEVMRNIKKLYDGSITKHPKVETYQGKNIKISSTKDIYLETDGESLGHTPMEFEIIPKSIKVISAINTYL